MEEKTLILIALVILYIVIVFLFSRIGDSREIGTRKLFWRSLFLTPVIGLAFFLSSGHRKITPFTERKYKCERCGYVFSEELEYCPFCEKEGIKQELSPVKQYMT